MFNSPEILYDLAKEHERDLLAQAAKHRVGSALRRAHRRSAGRRRAGS